MDDDFEVYVEEVLKETDKSILVQLSEDEHAILDYEGEKPIWIPKTQIREYSEVTELGDTGTLVISRWLANERGWT